MYACKAVKKTAKTGDIFTPFKKFLHHYAVLKLYLQEPSLTRISHKPRCETIELFSYIGGYLGLWLGFSAMAFIDFLHSLFGFFYLTIQQQSRRFTSEFTDK
ncbi:hypothetical protein X975_00142, partial [Stegodyphus mimosarum]